MKKLNIPNTKELIELPPFVYTSDAELDDLKKDYPIAKVRGHTDFDKGKTCPNFDAGKWYETDEIVSTM